ncbi:MAG: hypothetical protein VYB54_04240 [Pseudomonadota bacterium]|nr:hypothetical protein [Pseudomonadota bacterium]
MIARQTAVLALSMAMLGSPLPVMAADDMPAMIRELNTLVDDAERARAADPRFIADLRRLLERYDDPFDQVLLQDRFEDGDFTAGPAWQVASGSFDATRYGGLVSEVATAAPATGGQGQSSGNDQGAQAFARVVGSIIREAARREGDGTSDTSAAATAPANTQPALIFLPGTISNAFRLEAAMELPSDPSAAVELGVFQGRRGDVGYRLVLRGSGGAELRRVGRKEEVLARGAFAMPAGGESWRAPELAVEWRRDRDGTMRVLIDGTESLSFADTTFRDRFDGFRMANLGGRQALRSITISGRL